MSRLTKLESNSVFLVTGGAGFIGSNLCEALLENGYEVKCLDNLSTGKRENIDDFFANPKFSFLNGDIRDYELCLTACTGVDYVLHQAAWGSVPRSIKMPLLYEEINVQGTLNMMEASLRNSVKKFVYASSSSVYGNSVKLPRREGSEGQLLSPYAVTKRTNEEYGKLYKTLYNLDTYGLRYFNVFGPRQDPEGEYAAVIPKFIRQIMKGESPVIFGDGRQSRDFTYIDNVIEANLKACQASSEIAGEIFNIAYGGRENLLDVFHFLCDVLGQKVEPIFLPERKGDIRHSNADISKASNDLDFQLKSDFETGILKSIDWYKEHL